MRTAENGYIRVYMINAFVNDLASFASAMKIDNPELLSRMIWDPETPDYIFVSEEVYLVKQIYEEFLEYLERCPDSIRIGVYTEAIMPDLNLFDYAICFDYNSFGDRISRIPMLVHYSSSLLSLKNELTAEEAHELYHTKRFCNFMYSNKDAHPMRDKLFYKLSEYKPVESTGKHLRNAEIADEDRDQNWRVESILVKLHYRFAISSENAIYPGYTSEKILSSFQGHAIPIYWGNPQVKRECNPEAFICADDFESLDDLRDYVAKIDGDEDKWCDIVMKPWFTEEQLVKAMDDMRKYQDFVSAIFMNDKESVRRRPEGYWPEIYRNWLFRRDRMRNIPALNKG